CVSHIRCIILWRLYGALRRGTPADAPRLALGGRHQPRRQSVWLLQRVQVLDKAHEDPLEHICRGLLVEAATPRDTEDEALITPHERLPRLSIASPARVYELRVCGFHRGPAKNEAQRAGLQWTSAEHGIGP